MCTENGAFRNFAESFAWLVSVGQDVRVFAVYCEMTMDCRVAQLVGTGQRFLYGSAYGMLGIESRQAATVVV